MNVYIYEIQIEGIAAQTLVIFDSATENTEDRPLTKLSLAEAQAKKDKYWGRQRSCGLPLLVRCSKIPHIGKQTRNAEGASARPMNK